MGSLAPAPDFYSGKERKLPAWAAAWHGSKTLFIYEGTVWRIVLSGSHNNTPERSHICWCNIRNPVDEDGNFTCTCPPRLDMFVEFVRAIPANQEQKMLIAAPCNKADLAVSLKEVQSQGRMFTPNMLAKATHVVPPQGG